MSNPTPIPDGIIQPPPGPSDLDLLSTAQDELQAAAGLCRAGALALRAAAEPDIPAALPEVQKPVAGIVENALKRLERALDALENIDDANTDPIFNVYGLLLVIQSALIADKPIDGRDMVMDPIADSLEVVTDTLGEDIDEGLKMLIALQEGGAP